MQKGFTIQIKSIDPNILKMVKQGQTNSKLCIYCFLQFHPMGFRQGGGDFG